MRKHIVASRRVLLLTVVILAGLVAGCSDSQVRKVREINADLSLALNRAAVTTIEYTQQGVLSPTEQAAILPRFNDATILSDGIVACTEAVDAKDTLTGCVTPLLTSIQDDIDAASLGIKSETARALFYVTLKSLNSFVQAIAGVK